MKNKSLLFIFSLLIALLFISCDGDIKISIYTRDLDDVMKSKEEVIYTNVNLIVESLQDENDIAFLRNCLNGFSNEHPVEYNYSTSLSFDIKIPIVTEGTELDYSKDLLILSGEKNKDQTDFYLTYNHELFSRIDRYFYNTHYQNIELNKFKIKYEINNDERKDVELITYSSYVNGKSYPFIHSEVLKERDRLSIDVSEIFRNYISNTYNSEYPLFSIKK